MSPLHFDPLTILQAYGFSVPGRQGLMENQLALNRGTSAFAVAKLCLLFFFMFLVGS